MKRLLQAIRAHALPARANLKEQRLRILTWWMTALALGPAAVAAQDAGTLAGTRIRIVVPFTPGGSVDGLARTVGSALQKTSEAAVIVENKPGAGGNIAASFVARSPPGTHVNLLVSSINFYVNPAVQRDPGYDAYQDFAPIAYLASMPYVMVVPGDSPIDSVKDLVARARALPGRLSWGFGGNGTLGHFVGAALEDAGGFKGTPIAYRGGPDLLAALGGKHIDMVIMTMQSAAPLIRQGRLKGLAVTGAERNKVMPQLPTIGEQVSGYPPLAGYAFLLAPSTTPESLLVRLHAEMNKVVRSEAYLQRLEGDGGTAQVFATLAEAKSYFDRDGQRWAALTRKSGIKVE